MEKVERILHLGVGKGRITNRVPVYFLISDKMRILRFLFLDPIQNLYLHLPYIGWDGKFKSQICASMTGIPEKHWVFEGDDECHQMIERNFSSKMTVLKSAIQLYLVVSTSADIIYITRRKILSFFFTAIENDSMCG